MAGALCAAALMALGVGAVPAQADFDDPTWILFNSPQREPGVTGTGYAPPGTGFEGPCGLAVDIAGNLYVSDYYHRAVDVYKSTGPAKPGAASPYITQLSGLDPIDGPCGIALDFTGRIYVNDYHRAVTRHTQSVFPTTTATKFSPAKTIDSNHPTGVAVRLITGDVYVDNRTYVAVYDSAGAPVMDGGNPLKIGLGTLGDGYGLAVSNHLLTEGRIYVPDASTDTVKVYDPDVDVEAPIEEIEKPGGFGSLRDSAVAVDSANGDVYVAERVGTRFTEHPETAIQVFDSNGDYKGRLKYNVVDGSPVGLAVDNSTGPNQGRVYVTSGNTADGSIYAYPPGAVTLAELPAVFSLGVTSTGNGEGSVTSIAAGLSCSNACQADVPATATVSLSASADPGSTFEGWSGGGCSGTGECTVQMTEATSVAAEFSAPVSDPPAPAPQGTPAPSIAPSTAPSTTAQPQRANKRKKTNKRRKHAKRHRKAKQQGKHASKRGSR